MYRKGGSRNRWFRWLEKKKQIRALETLVDTKYEKMYRIAFNYTHSKEDALDVIQESFEKALKAIQKDPILRILKRGSFEFCFL